MKKRHGTAQNCSLQRFFPSVFQPFQGIKKSKMVARWIYKNANKQGFIYAVHSISNIPKMHVFYTFLNNFHQKKRLQLDNFFIYFYLISYVLFNVFIVFLEGERCQKILFKPCSISQGLFLHITLIRIWSKTVSTLFYD